MRVKIIPSQGIVLHQMNSRARYLAFIVAAVAFASLVLQLYLIIAKMTADGAIVVHAVWRYLGYFTILSNILVAVVSTAMALAPASRLAGARMRLTAATAIGMVGIVYSVALRNVWQPQGWQAIADHALHDAVPPLFLLAWFSTEHGQLQYRDAAWAMTAPALYLAYSLTRGTIDGWYAYWFFDPGKLTITQLSGNAAVLMVAFFTAGVVLVAIDRWLAKRGTKTALT